MSNPRSGYIKWANWDFRYEVTDNEGLALLNGSYMGRHYICKFSLPVIRVKYETDSSTATYRTGPFADRLGWKNVVLNKEEKVSVYEFILDGATRWLEISIYSRIGAYHLFQAWYLSEWGNIYPQIWSKGLQVNLDHTHHTYWRFDFDIDGWEKNQVYRVDNRKPYLYTREANDIKIPDIDRYWLIYNSNTKHAAAVSPGPNDGYPDSFSKIDVAVRLYHQPESANPWPFDAGELGFFNGEYVGNSDIVFWYVAHLHHHASEGADAWHSAGPLLSLNIS